MKYENNLWWPDSEDHLNHYGLNYQREIRDLAIGLIPTDKRPLALDIGAHVGIASVHFSQYFKEVIAFEPNKSSYDCLIKNTDDLPITCLNKALSNKHGFVKLEVNPSNTGNTVPVLLDQVDLFDSVQSSPLDSYQFPEPSLIKIDVEGFEPLVIEGARETLIKHKPVIIIEAKGIGYSKGREVLALDLLKDLGYRIAGSISHDFILVKE